MWLLWYSFFAINFVKMLTHLQGIFHLLIFFERSLNKKWKIHHKVRNFFVLKNMRYDFWNNRLEFFFRFRKRCTMHPRLGYLRFFLFQFTAHISGYIASFSKPKSTNSSKFMMVFMYTITPDSKQKFFYSTIVFRSASSSRNRSCLSVCLSSRCFRIVKSY